MKHLCCAGALLLLTLVPATADESNAPVLTQGPVIGVGIGVKIEDHQPTIDQVIPGNSAYKQGVKVGDRLLEIDGADVSKLSLARIASLLRGAANTRVKLTILRGDRTRETFHLKRQIVVLTSPTGSGQPLAH